MPVTARQVQVEVLTRLERQRFALDRSENPLDRRGEVLDPRDDGDGVTDRQVQRVGFLVDVGLDDDITLGTGDAREAEAFLANEDASPWSISPSSTSTLHVPHSP